MYLRGLVHIASVRQLLNQVILNNKLNRTIANDISQVLKKTTPSAFTSSALSPLGCSWVSMRQLLNQVILNNKLNRTIANDISQVLKKTTPSAFTSSALSPLGCSWVGDFCTLVQ